MDANITVVGGSNIDISAKSAAKIIGHDSNIGEVEFGLGGVGRNIAEGLSILGANVSLLTAVGDDSFGSVVQDNAREQGISLLAEPFENGKTGVYVCINDNDGSFYIGINDMDIISRITPQIIEEHINALYFADYVILDSNLSADTIQAIANHNFCLIADCVSTLKCPRLIPVLDKLWLIKANLPEARTLIGAAEDADAITCIKGLVAKGLEQGIVTLGKDGAMSFQVEKDKVRVYYVSNLPGTHPSKNTSGCGDALLSGFMIGLTRGRKMRDALIMGQAASYLNAQSFSSVNKDMSFSDLKDAVRLFEDSATITEEVIKL